MKTIKLFTFFLLILLQAAAQQPAIKILETGKKISLRGLSVVDDHIIWASGSKGSVAKSLDGGQSWTWISVPGYEQRDFRDIEAFDKNTAMVMAVAEPGVILKTKDGGNSWMKVFEDSTKGMFLDAMDFVNDSIGVVIGDPIQSILFAAGTIDGGDHWFPRNPIALNKGEAFFASSGTNIKLLKERKFNHLQSFMVSGGKSARLFIGFGQQIVNLPISQGLESTGANSIDVFNNKIVVVGGDFTKDTVNKNNCVLVSLKNKVRVTTPATPPHGYRSCVIYLDEYTLLTCGTSGIDISTDGGKNWQLISKESFHVCQKAKKGKSVFLAGGNGRIARLVY
ncbi:MAG: YCF48-related protein [Chitinophagaceae bacterium]|nr:YCF48-related protein [Chitinophagaceae bacterium]MDP1812368.1 YCF48-related protein [Sediminibacterium sp.]MDP3129160.1 YCF48-related protein [Sediminibacterium sp.]